MGHSFSAEMASALAIVLSTDLTLPPTSWPNAEPLWMSRTSEFRLWSACLLSLSMPFMLPRVAGFLGGAQRERERERPKRERDAESKREGRERREREREREREEERLREMLT